MQLIQTLDENTTWKMSIGLKYLNYLKLKYLNSTQF